MDNQEWLIPTIAIVISAGTLWWRITKAMMNLATKEDVKDLKAEMKSDHAALASKVESLNETYIRHLEQHINVTQSNPG